MKYKMQKGDDHLIQATAQGKGGMHGFGSRLTQTQIKAIVEYLKLLAGGQ